MKAALAAAQARCEQAAHITAAWPLCAVCGKSAREGNHATDLGQGHDYVPAQPKKEKSK